jgi:hypothetical protein
MKKHIIAIALSLAAAPALAANDNDEYGEVNLRRLHGDDAFVTVSGKLTLKDRGQVSRVPWVGSWWAYSRNGIANRYFSSSELSPAEKMDKARGREGSIESAKIDQYHAKVSGFSAKATERQAKIKEINAWLATHPNGDWRNETFGKRYLELDNELTKVKNELKTLLTMDTATEFDKIKHGQGEFGVQGWWGHCNAWSAAAIMDPEPRRAATVNNINWRIGDVKGLLTESWMEHRSSFFGTRCDSGDFTTVECKDVTPAAFHIYFVDQISNKDRSFVIDRFSGDEVWNQPIRGYLTRCTALPKEAGKKVKMTTYGYSGDGTEGELSARDVWPLSCSTTIHWVTDGVPHETLLVDNARNIDSESDFSNASTIGSRYDHQFEIRTLTYKLYLTAPIDSRDAEIWGDGEWTSLTTDDHGKPDFMWQPLSQTGASSREYENRFVDYDWIKANVLPKVTGAEPPASGGGTPTGAKTYTSAKVETNTSTVTALSYPAAIPDNNTSGIRGEIVVDDEFKIRKATVIPDMTHTYRGDLRVTIQHYPSKLWTYISNKQGGSEDNLKDPVDIGAKFKDKTSKGRWVLRVSDREAQDTGKFNGWKLVLEP